MTQTPAPVLLVDFENIQDLDYLKKLRNTDYEVRVFLGPHQSRIQTELVRQAQPFGDRLHWIQMEGQGKNALDFHIAYTLGLLVAESRARKIYVLSKDTGFDPLISYLAKRNIACERIEEMGRFLTRPEETHPVEKTKPHNEVAIPSVPAKATASGLNLTDVVMHLNAIPARTRPKKPDTLAAHLANHFKKQGAGTNFARVVQELEKIGKISVSGQKLVYHNK